MRHGLGSGRRLLAVAAIVVLVVAAGIAGAFIRSAASDGVPVPFTASAATPAVPADGRVVTDGSLSAGQATGPTTVAPVPEKWAGNANLGVATGSAAAPSLTDETLVVKTGTLDLEVKDLGATLVKARALVSGLGGYVGASQQSNQGEQQVAMVTYRIPADRWDAAIEGLTALAGRVVHEQTSAVEVTGQVLDLGARITNLRATEQALQAIMARAIKISDVLEVQQQLTDVRGQIEQLSTEKAHLEQQAAFGSLTTTYTVPVVAVTATASGWDPRAEIDRAAAQLLELAQGAATAAIWFGIVALPLIVVAVLVLLPIAFIGRRLARPREPRAPLWGPPPAADPSDPAA